MSFKHRVKNLLKALESKDVNVLVLFNTDNIYYFTGFKSLGSSAALVNSDGVTLYVPPLEYERALSEVFETVEVKVYTKYKLDFDIGADKISFKSLVDAIADDIRGSSSVHRLGLELASTPYNVVLKLAKLLSIKVIDITEEVSKLREVKDLEEIRNISRAIEIAQESLGNALKKINDKVKEVDLAAMIEYEMKVKSGEEPAFNTIVACGAKTSQPHARPEFKRIKYGEPLIIDLGAKYQGYCSDLTRTIMLGKARNLYSDFNDIYNAVLEAQRVAIKSIKPNIKASVVDSTARRVFEEYKLSKYFIHSLGHGIGLNVHERPKISQDSSELLKPGMVFTVEPGVYIKGKYGVRIEDVVVVTDAGCRVLSTFTRELV